jgi:RimJ/RimL family protein N-acetyltransferase
MASTISVEGSQRKATGSEMACGPTHGLPDLAYPTLATPRFQFRPFVLTDIQQLVAIAGEHRIADTTIGIPHPYTAEFARMWISTHGVSWEGRHALHWAARKIGDDSLAGYAGLNRIDMQRGQAELRFWVGVGVERHSDATEWSEAIVEFALTGLKINRVYALQLARHPLVGHVLAALGMRQEGLVRKRIHPGGLVEDVICWSLLSSHWHPMSQVSF